MLASRREVTEEDLERLDAELLDDAELRTWIDAVGPGLRDDRPMQGRGARIASDDDVEVGEGVANATERKREYGN